MRIWVILLTIASLLSLPFSGSLAAEHDSRNSSIQSTSAAEHHASSVTSDANDCADSVALSESSEHCCDETASSLDCTKCPPDCGHCVMSDSGSTAALTMQQTFSSAVVASAVVAKNSFYQLLTGQPSPPPIIS